MTTNTPKYGGLLTDIGAAALAAASAAGKKWQPTHMLIGDAGGAPGDTPDPLPSAAQKSLINQRHRAQLNRLFVSDKNANTLVAEVVLPVEVGASGSARSACRMPTASSSRYPTARPATRLQWKVAVRGPRPFG